MKTHRLEGKRSRPIPFPVVFVCVPPSPSSVNLYVWILDTALPSCLPFPSSPSKFPAFSPGCAEGYARDATEIQNIQIADGDVCRGLPIPIYMVFPRLFTCPTLETTNFKVGKWVGFCAAFTSSIRNVFSVTLASGRWNLHHGRNAVEENQGHLFCCVSYRLRNWRPNTSN